MIEVRHTSNRHIVKRIIVQGTLILDTPTCLGSGDTDSLIDLPLLRDSISNYALLTGSSIAGALRNYLRECDQGYNVADSRHDLATKLFGDLFLYQDEAEKLEKEKLELKAQDNQSLLIINDAIISSIIKAELRDGVKINSVTRTAQNKAKYDLELLEAGTHFKLCFELLLEKGKEANNALLLNALALALHGLEPNNDIKSGEISIGMKKQRGFGRCHVKEWQVWEFDMSNPNERLQWLTMGRNWAKSHTKSPTVSQSIETALKVKLEKGNKRDRLIINATFTLASPLLIRSGQASIDKAPDVVHLKSHRPQEKADHSESTEVSDRNLVAVLSGTSLAGVLRHRAERIVNTLEKDTSIIDEIFGTDFTNDRSKQAKASRLIVHESIIKNTADLVQNRIAIDRFTGGAYHGALFSEQPIFGSNETELNIELELRQPKNYEIGLILLLIKDLWTGDLPVGGTSSIGRGRLQGKKAEITLYDSQDNTTWTISQYSKDEPLIINDAQSLEKFVTALYEEVTA